MKATGSVSWVGAQASVLGRCGGGVPYPSSSSASAQERGAGGGGRFRVVGVVRCCAQDKKPPRVRKTKEERREMVEAFVNTYRISNGGKFPSVNLTHKEVGGSYYIVREIVRDIIQENRVLGPGGLNAKVLRFEDCSDSSEQSIRQELDKNNIETYSSDENEVSKSMLQVSNSEDSMLEVSKSEEGVLSQKNAINTQQLVGSSYLLESSTLNTVVQNVKLVDAACLETNLEKHDEGPCGNSRVIDIDSSGKQTPSFAQVSDSDKEIELDSLEDGNEETSRSAIDEVILPSEPSDAFQTNGAHLQEPVTLPNDPSAIEESKVYLENNGVHQTNHTPSQKNDILPENVTGDGVPVIDGKVNSTVGAFDSTTSYVKSEDSAKSVELSGVQRAQKEFEQSILSASPDGQEKLEGLVSQPELGTQGLMHMKDKRCTVEEGESKFSKSTSTIRKDECEASAVMNENGISTTTAISRHALCLLTLRCMLTVYNFLHTSQKATA